MALLFMQQNQRFIKNKFIYNVVYIVSYAMFTYTIISTSNAMLRYSFLYYLPILVMALTTGGVLSIICLSLAPLILLGYFCIWHVNLTALAIIIVLLSGIFTLFCILIVKKLHSFISLFIIALLNTSVEAIQNIAIHKVSLSYLLTWNSFFIYLANTFVILLVYRFVTYIQTKTSELDLKLDQALKDELTNLFNYQKLKVDFLTQEYAFKNQAVLILDIDHFKTINDTYGHEIGNIVLAQFSSKLMLLANQWFDSNSFRIYRYGGEEIVLIINDAIPTINSFLDAVKHNINLINIDYKFTLTAKKHANCN